MPRLLNEPRFPDGRKLLERFDHEVDVWREKRGDGFSFRQLINFGNEVAAAVGLLDHVTNLAVLQYEPRIPGVAKTLDFLLLDAPGNRAWVDVKTVAPQWVDDEPAWQRFLAFSRTLPENTHFGVKREFGGAGLAGQAIKARWSFATRSLEVEQKAALIPETMRGPVSLLLCSDYSAWHPDDLEDFADLYRTGRFRDDDWSRNELLRYMGEKEMSFARTLSGFHHLRRRHDEVGSDLRFNLRGPSIFAPSDATRDKAV
ncbi:MAG: hypothetical protein ACREUT_01600 [Steroidobacteraceae bacterium]